MKKLNLFIISMLVSVVLCGTARQAVADEYDDSQSHPLRVLAYIVHPVGVLAEWVLARPFHFLVSATPELEYIFGHRPHPPILAEPDPLHDYGVSRRVPLKDPPPVRAALPQE